MNVCVHHVEAIVRNRFFIMNFAFVSVRKGKTYSVTDFSVHGKHDGENFSKHL